MGQVLAIAAGGACGSVLRFYVSTGVYQWLGRGFPYGTLAVNVVGSFLIGLLAEALILQRVALTLEFRAAILVGVLGGFTTFSSFALETLYLLEQGQFIKAAANIGVSVFVCLAAAWLGVLSGRSLYCYAGGILHWPGGAFPYAIITVNALVSALLGLVAALLMEKTAVAADYRAMVIILLGGGYLTLSGLYLLLFLLEHGFSPQAGPRWMLGVFAGNALLSLLTLWLGLMAGKRL